MNHLAIYATHPSVVSIDDGEGCFDKDGAKVEINYALVKAEEDRINAELPIKSCKEKAKELIAATDWAVLPDVGIANQSEFILYRTTLRSLIINPVADPVFPTEPTPVWS